MVDDSVKLLTFLEAVNDPEIPVVNVVELGIVRSAHRTDKGVKVTITPTYSGCPAMETIRREIIECLKRHDITDVEIETTYAPPWTSDWITDAAKKKLKAYGISPPGKAGSEMLIGLPRNNKAVACPHCGSKQTELRSEFGSTPCKALHYCNACAQPFEEFKAH